MPETASPLSLTDLVIATIKQTRLAVPPALGALANILSNYEELGEFVRLVDEFFPEHKEEILRNEEVSDQIQAFCSFFEEKYFPLSYYVAEGEAEEYQQLTYGIPLQLQEVDVENNDPWEPTNGYKHGLLMMLYLCHDWSNQDDNRHIAMADYLQKWLSVSLLQSVPEGGFEDEQINALRGTKYEPILIWYEMVEHQAGNDFIDYSEEGLSCSGGLSWSKENVEYLKVDWDAASDMWEKVNDFAAWLEEAPRQRFTEVVNAIGVNPADLLIGPPSLSMDEFARWLEQYPWNWKGGIDAEEEMASGRV